MHQELLILLKTIMKPSRVIQIISTRIVDKEKQYIISTTKIHWNGDSTTETKFITSKDVKNHLSTGKWHTISMTNTNNFMEEPIAIQILEHCPLQVKFEKYVENSVQRGEELFSKVFKKL